MSDVHYKAGDDVPPGIWPRPKGAQLVFGVPVIVRTLPDGKPLVIAQQEPAPGGAMMLCTKYPSSPPTLTTVATTDE